jgi:membrane-associated phospholipid phosphatase
MVPVLDPISFRMAKWVNDTDRSLWQWLTRDPDLHIGGLALASQWVTVAFTMMPIILMSLSCWIAGRIAQRPSWGRFGGVVIRAGLAQIIVTELLKRLFGRVRPSDALEMGAGVWHDVWMPLSSHQSFPSGHAAFALVFATLTIAYFPRARRFWIGLAAAIIAARWILLRHYVSDLWMGAWVGAFVGGTFVLSYPPIPDRVLVQLERRRAARRARQSASPPRQ